MRVPFHERRIYLSAYKRLAVITVQTRHTSDNRVRPPIYRSGTWMDGTPLTDEENAVAKERFAEIEELRKPAAPTETAASDEPTDGWPFITW